MHFMNIRLESADRHYAMDTDSCCGLEDTLAHLDIFERVEILH